MVKKSTYLELWRWFKVNLPGTMEMVQDQLTWNYGDGSKDPEDSECSDALEVCNIRRGPRVLNYSCDIPVEEIFRLIAFKNNSFINKLNINKQNVYISSKILTS